MIQLDTYRRVIQYVCTIIVSLFGEDSCHASCVWERAGEDSIHPSSSDDRWFLIGESQEGVHRAPFHRSPPPLCARFTFDITLGEG